MTSPIERLLALLALESVEGDTDAQTWRGQTGPMAANMSGRLFGGVVIAQAIVAAGLTDPGRRVHSAQLHFLRGGSVEEPADYHCVPLFDGRTYASWRIDVRQSQHLIAHAIVGLTTGVGEGPDWHEPAPPMPNFDTAVDRDRHSRRRDPATQPVHTMVDPDQHDDASPGLTLWLRPNGAMPESPLLHQAVLGYISDRAMLSAARKAHADHGPLRGTTLDHSIWFHRPVVFDTWHSHAMRSSTVVDGRGMSHGAIHRDDTLIATTAQQSALRPRREQP